jgi:hypothetical protein
MMAGLDDLSRGELGRMKRDVRQLGTAAPLQNSSIGAGGLRVHSGGVITIENGGLKVTGTAEIIGTLIASGVIDFTGDVTISGPLTISGDTDVTGDFKVTGPTHLEGATDIKGTLSVEGATTLKGDMTLTTGKIKAGGLTIDPSASGGSLVFSGGGGVQGGSGPTVIKGAGNAGLISDTTASVFAGANSVDVSPTAVTINGPLKAPGITSTTNAANVYFDPSSKQLYYKP